MTRRRMSCPQTTHKLWDAIKIIRYQRQIPDQIRISQDVSRHLGHCVRDNLVRLVKRVGFKGSQTGKKQESYRLPQGAVKKDNHDWYCFECHGGGDVICCTGCHRVYHLSCVATDLSEDDVKKTFVCSVCKMCKESDKFKISRRELNHLLGFTCSRLKERLPVVITERQVPSKQLYISDRAASSTAALQRRNDPSLGIKWVTDDEDAWRVNYLIYQPMDLQTMDCKAKNKKYRTLEEFQADAQTIVHNVVIYHGVNSSLADMARQMLRDCIYDLQEIRQCRDCYRMSNEKEDKHWFCQPCKPQHELVYAKQKGFPYWPAKVIKIEGQMYDVRFFGGHHQRAVLDKIYIRPISVNIHTLQVKRTSSWNKACEELRRHRAQLEKFANSSEVEDSSFDDDDDIDTVCVVHLNSVVRDHVNKKDTNSQEDVVSSSCKEQRSRTLSTQTPARWMKALSKNENSKFKLTKESELEKQKTLDADMKNLEERLKAENAAQLKDIIEKHNLLISETKRKHNQLISETKRKQWLANVPAVLSSTAEDGEIEVRISVG
uniref:(California timema) hypothetical protein n=1 Tax=Timema californicum TaxID=61474 RepID=A0A7R9IUV1_TIMCA|nr:unnamed protein product [Timema californicum]